ncbi:FAD-dependent urate hydroxylase [Halomonadaceae bacterium LMG 33818]|uniref:FAD-dependent urate hydroxylase HpxO n=1 Tax=Cernens ardua TaxID=3402176 RepID=UPI003EDC7B50
MKQLNIVIAGAGIGGLTAAIALQRQGHQVHLYDRVALLAPAGSAISVWPNGVKVLDALGLGSELDRSSGDMKTMSYYDHQGKRLTRFSLEPLYNSVGRAAKPVARSALQNMLVKAVGIENITLGQRCKGYKHTPQGLKVLFDNGKAESADLLIAADGTHSRLRNQILDRQIERQYCGYVNWNGRIKTSDIDLDPDEWTQFVGDGKRVSFMPMGKDRFYFFLDVPLPAGTPNVSSSYRNELKEHFSGWAKPVQDLIEKCDTDGIARVEIHDIQPVDRFHDQSVVMIGDAAHAMAPDLGQGGCQAMEDAWVLTELLAANDGEIAPALAQFDQQRVSRTASIIERAHKRCDITHGKNPTLTQEWYEELSVETGADIMAGMEKTIKGGPIE